MVELLRVVVHALGWALLFGVEFAPLGVFSGLALEAWSRRPAF